MPSRMVTESGRVSATARALENVPAWFEPNAGQYPSGVKFHSLFPIWY